MKLEPAPLSETLVLVPLTPGMGVLIAAILHKLSIEFLPKCAFSLAHTAVTLNEMTVSSHSLCSPAIPLLTSLLADPPISLSFSLSLSSLCFASVGTSNERLPSSDWMMYEVIRVG